MSVKNYDPKQVIVIVAGQQMSGFPDGSFVSVEREVDTFSKRVGVDGEVARSRSNNKSGTMTLTLMQTSASNDILSALHIADELSGNGIVPVIITDLLGTTKFFAAEGWIRKPASAEFADEAGDREWLIDLAAVDMFIGGAS